MYVTNISASKKETLYECDTLLKDWLTIFMHIPVYGMSEEGKWYFVKTEKLTEALDSLPEHLAKGGKNKDD